MDLTTSLPRLSRATLYGLGLALLWLVLAFLRPSVTFHIAPLLVAASVPWMLVSEHGSAATTARRLTAVAIGALIGLIATGLLAAAGRLSGSSLLPEGGAAVESLVGIGIGVVIGLASLAWRPASRL